MIREDNQSALNANYIRTQRDKRGEKNLPVKADKLDNCYLDINKSRFIYKFFKKLTTGSKNVRKGNLCTLLLGM